jgi:hypothetical protein
VAVLGLEGDGFFGTTHLAPASDAEFTELGHIQFAGLNVGRSAVLRVGNGAKLLALNHAGRVANQGFSEKTTG